MLQCWQMTGHLPSFFVPAPGNCHPRPKKMPLPGVSPGGGGGLFAGGIDWCINWFHVQKSERQTSRDLHSDCFAMVLTAGFYCDSRAHNVRKVRVVKYIVVYGQIKAADQKYCHNQRWRRKLKEISFRTRGFGDNLDDFWPRYCRA